MMRKLMAGKSGLGSKGDKEPSEFNEEAAQDTIPAHNFSPDDAEKLHHAQEIVKELYVRYEKQVQRWIDYRNLFVFLGFVALFLAVLYLQRNAHIAYKVHSTIESVVLPDTDTMQETDSVLDWLQGLLQTVWQDPVCGDGLCESPFEFASYGRFGCRADCGKLSEVQNLTTIQVDIYYDFTHPTGSIPASELMNQASWNMCPVNGTPASDCYYDSDQQFSQLSGEQHLSIDDVPDGNWTLRIKQDIFNKVAGSVRDTDALRKSAFYDKVYVAHVSARAEQAFEIGLLQKAVELSNSSVFEYMFNQLQGPNGTFDQVDLQIIINATCYCSNGSIALRNTTWRSASGVPGVIDLTWYQNTAANLPVTVNGSTTTYRGCGDYVSSGLPMVPYDKNNQSALVTVTNDTQWCSAKLGILQTYSNKYWDAMRKLLVDTRLGDDGRTSGKKYIRYQTRDTLRSYIQGSFPERIDWIFTTPIGTDAVGNPASCRLDELTRVYVESPSYSVDPAPASSNLTRTRVYRDATATVPVLGLRAAARVAEIYQQQNEVLLMKLPMGNLTGITVGRLYAAYTGAGANASTVVQSTKLANPFSVNYNYVTWQGNTTAYMVCDLMDRSPEYKGTCQAAPVLCSKTSNENRPWICTVAGTNTTIPGFINQTDYRLNCETTCERITDCSTVCECFGGCNSGQVCTCDVCNNMASDATTDGEFQSIESAALVGGGSAQAVAEINLSGKKRRLLQANSTITDSLSQVLTKVDQLRVQQQTITGQMASLQTQVQQANTLAEQRAQDKTLEQLIQAGRADIQAGQKRVEDKLDEIIGKQNQMQAVADQAAKVLQRISDLSQRQLEAQQALEKAVQSQLYAIKVAAQQNIISLAQALELWKRARRDRALATKAAKLANIPCNSQPTQDNQFDVSRSMIDPDGDQHRERNIGLTNRVIGGMLVHTWRTKQVSCAKSRFDQIQSQCTGGEDLRPYGVDPVFKRGTDLYNPDFDDLNHTIVLQYYNCSQFEGKPTYDIVDKNTGQVTNSAPYCGELYNPRELPWGFHYFPLNNLPNGFPVWFDIDLSADDAQTWFTNLQDGLYLDGHTRGLIAHMVTYNAELRIFGAYRLKFYFSDGGSIQITHRLHTLRVELYHSAADQGRMALEVILSMFIFAQLAVEFWRMYGLRRGKAGVLAYFKSGWNWVHFISNALLSCCIVIWWVFVTQNAKNFKINLSYKVYNDLEPDANFLQLNSNGDGLREAWGDFNSLDDLINLLNWYYALNGINILLLIARVLKLMDFQPRLGVVTRSLALAGPDLIHFSLVAGMVFIGYAMMAHLIFGNAIDEFSSFASSINTCFEILLGNIDVNNQLRALPGLQNLAGTLFFWSYELLVFMVLLNFLLAIIVDAFSEVKENTQETTGLHTELGQIIRDKWRSLVGTCTGNYISDKKLGLLLKQWAGHTGPAEEQTLVEDVGEKKLRVMGEDVDEDTLREILEACLQDSALMEEDEKAAGKSCFGKKKPLQATKEELELAAKYVIERFGTSSSVLEEEGEGGEEGAGGMEEGRGAKEVAMEKERDQLAHALERLADVQRELAEGQRNLMAGQKQLAEQQARLVALMKQEGGPKQ